MTSRLHREVRRFDSCQDHTLEKRKMKKKNLYHDTAQYYDFLEDKKKIAEEIKFLTRNLKKAKVKTILDVGCGTGIYLVGLKKKGFDIEGLDLSEAMLKETKKKDSKIKLYKKDMSSFEINKKYDSILCLSSSMAALTNFTLMKKTIKNIFNHLNCKGFFILDLPNHSVEIKKFNNIRKNIFGEILGGKANMNFFSTKKGNKWKQIWSGEIIRNGKKEEFKEKWDELIYSPEKLESYLKKVGFKLLKIYGSLDGEKFNKNKSYHRVYLLKKQD